MLNESVLVIGGDSFVGQTLIIQLKQLGALVTSSTRRDIASSENNIFLDLADLSTLPIEKYNYVIFLAGIWDYHACDSDPLAFTVNVENMEKAARYFLKANSNVSFVSSNTVFGGRKPWPNEYEEHSPLFSYARHKSLAEKRLLKCASDLKVKDKLQIIRLTKVLNIDTSPIPSWLSSWGENKIVYPFSDLIFAPISIQFASEGIARIVESKKGGAFHLSGCENINYVCFAEKLLQNLGGNISLVLSTTSSEKGIDIPFLPIYSGLNMELTQDCVGISPQSIESVIDDILN